MSTSAKRTPPGVSRYMVWLFALALFCCLVLSRERVTMNHHQQRIDSLIVFDHTEISPKNATQSLSNQTAAQVLDSSKKKNNNKKSTETPPSSSSPPPNYYRLPSVQIIGAQKAGTTALAFWLEREEFSFALVFDGEPDYFKKEVHFFDYESRYNQGLEFYAKRFSSNRSNHGYNNIMDATPDTFPYPDRVKATYDAAGGNQTKNLKIIVSLREPISRELSLYNHVAHGYRSGLREQYFLQAVPCNHNSMGDRNSTNTTTTIMTFDEFVQNVSIPALRDDYINPQNLAGFSSRHSKYALHLSQWFQHFDRQQILVLGYDEIKHNPQKVQQRVRKFLGKPLPGELRTYNDQKNPKKIHSDSISNETRTALTTILEPLNEDLYQLLEENPGPSMEKRPFPRFE